MELCPIQVVGEGLEQRKSTRYRLPAPVIFTWTDPSGLSQVRGGFARDISAGGLFVLCDASPPLETALTLEVLLPPLKASSTVLRLKGEGRVVRVAMQPTGFGAASEFDPNLLKGEI